MLPMLRAFVEQKLRGLISIPESILLREAGLNDPRGTFRRVMTQNTAASPTLLQDSPSRAQPKGAYTTREGYAEANIPP